MAYRKPVPHEPAAAFARMAVDAGQEGDLTEAERLARLAERFARLRLKLEPGELAGLGRMRRQEVRIDRLAFLVDIMIDTLGPFLDAARLAEAQDPCGEGPLKLRRPRSRSCATPAATTPDAPA
jgi:hypothetical protein